MNKIRLFLVSILLVLLNACSNSGGNDDQPVVELSIDVTSVFSEGDFTLNGGAFPLAIVPARRRTNS